MAKIYNYFVSKLKQSLPTLEPDAHKYKKLFDMWDAVIIDLLVVKYSPQQEKQETYRENPFS